MTDHELDALRRTHTPAAIRKRLGAGPEPTYLKDFIYGAIDGAVTTFAVVCGVVGAELPPVIIVVLGAANLLADGFSMAASNFLGTRAEKQLHHRTRRMEEHHIRRIPEGEREEVRQIFAAKGFSGEDLDRAVAIITSDLEAWIQTMLTEEHGLSQTNPSALRAAATTLLAFLVIGALPLAPFTIEMSLGVFPGDPFTWSVVLTGAAFIIVGAAKGRVVHERWYTSALETLVVGAGAAALAFVVGRLLRGIA